MAFVQQPVTYKIVAVPYKVPEGAVPFSGVPQVRPTPTNLRVREVEAQKPQPEYLPKKKVRSTGSLPRPDFNPYTLMDSQGTFTRTNGLGAFMIGSEDWMRKKEQHERRQVYARHVLETNHALIVHQRPKRDSHSPVLQSARQRALAFAKGIKKPTVEPKSTVASHRAVLPDPLDQLEAQHAQLRGRVESFKAYLL